ncbi:MAG: hypothetical protein IJ074_11885 [Clostridia bacterium]|nr:hypothetical protein [Clostridia bacterium]
MNGSVHDGHRSRLWERAKAEGLEHFQPHEILELLLFYAIPRQDTSAIAHRLIERFGSLQGVLNASPATLSQVQGVGRRASEWLEALGVLVDRYSNLRQTSRPQIRTVRDAQLYIRHYFSESNTKGAMHLCLTPNGRVQIAAPISASTLWADPKCLMQSLDDVLAAHAHHVIIGVHTDDRVPRIRDYDSVHAYEYARILDNMGVTLTDVILLDDDSALSLREQNRLPDLPKGTSASAFAEDYLSEA